MKQKKIITLLAAVAIVTSSANVAINAVQPLQAASTKANKYGLTKAYVFPKSLRGKWYSTNNLTPSPMNIHKTSFDTPWANMHVQAFKVGKVKGTNKYPWQMPSSWKKANKDVFTKSARVTTKKMHGNNWIVVSPADEKSRKMGFAYTVKVEKIDGKKQAVLFEALPQTGEVNNQYFRTKKSAQKYNQHHFKGMTYRKINPR